MTQERLLCNIHVELDASMKLTALIKICSNETYSRVHIGKSMTRGFPN